jgi:hypothetical protein
VVDQNVAAWHLAAELDDTRPARCDLDRLDVLERRVGDGPLQVGPVEDPIGMCGFRSAFGPRSAGRCPCLLYENGRPWKDVPTTCSFSLALGRRGRRMRALLHAV